VHFLLYTDLGSLILVLAAIVLVAVVVWNAVATVVTISAWALWVAYKRRRTRSPSRAATRAARLEPGARRARPPGRKPGDDRGKRALIEQRAFVQLVLRQPVRDARQENPWLEEK
jgi:hypothetical protein